MNQVKTNIEKAKHLILGPKKEQFDMIYPFSNENLAACLDIFNLQDKDCLTVLGSGDQALEMAYRGGKTLTTFDINPLTEYYFYLKKAALMSSMSLQEYLSFFCYEDYPNHCLQNQTAFNEKLFDKLIPFLNGDSNTFWTTLFNDFSPLEIRRSKKLFTQDELSYEVLKQTITYLNEENYQKLKEKAPDINITFINTDIINLESSLTNNYDFIYLSNIIQYAEKMYKKDNKLTAYQNNINKLRKYKLTTENLAKKLTKEGQMVVGYLYEPNRCTLIDTSSIIFDNEARNSVFNDNTYSYYHFQSVNRTNLITKYGFSLDLEEDACLIYQKQNKKR